ncbi:MAG: AEC family transporter [Thioalkalispiraceae bacterium]
MVEIILRMSVLIALGVLWRALQPGGISAETIRKSLTTVVLYLMLPALIIKVLWQAELGVSSFMISAVAITSILSGLLASFFFCRVCRASRPVTGAVMLASAFPNVTYMGLPILIELFGDRASSIAIQFDLFACTPLLFTVGVTLAQRFGQHDNNESTLQGLKELPPVWAAIIAVVFNLAGLPMHESVSWVLEQLANMVIPMMLFAVGLSLDWKITLGNKVKNISLIVVSQLFVLPLVALTMVSLFGFSGDTRTALVLEAAMPTMVIGLVLCDRYGLDTELYATAVTITTVLSLVTLNIWYLVL